jgi:hypothetical protein
MNEAYENKRRELIKSMDMSASQTMFEMHQAMCSEWATALADKIDEFAEMGNNGVGMFTQVAAQLTQFIDQKEQYFKQNFGSFESATASSPTFMGAMLRTFGNAQNPPEFEAQGVKDSKTQEDYANALKAVNMGYKYGSLTIEPDGIFIVFKGLPSNVAEVQDMETPFAPNLVELPVITGDEFAKDKAPQSAFKSEGALKEWMSGQLQTNESAINNAIRSYLKTQGEAGKKLTKEEVMADQQHMEEAKNFYIQQAMMAIETPDMPVPQQTEGGSMIPMEDEEVTELSFAGGGKFEFTMKDGAKVPAQIFRNLDEMDGPSKSVFSRFEAKYGSGAARKLGFALGRA